MGSCLTNSLKDFSLSLRRGFLVLLIVGVTGLVFTSIKVYIAAGEGVKFRLSQPLMPQDAPCVPTLNEASVKPCVRRDIERRPGKIVLATTNAAFIDFTDNWLESIRRTRACPNITIVAEDDTSFDYYAKKTPTYPGLHVVLTNSGTTTNNTLVFKTQEFKQFVNKRQKYILSYVEKGLEVLFTDVDTFWFRDPFPYFEGDFDFAAENGTRNVFCAGFLYLKPTENTKRFLRKWIELMEANENKLPDQKVMNTVIRRRMIPRLKVKVLDPANFPRGKLFFYGEWGRNKSDIAVVHNNGIVGHDPKVRRFKSCGMWLIQG